MNSNNFLKKIERSQTIEEKVYVSLKQMILTGELGPGTVTTETSIASQLGVSRTPIRRAISRLAQDGLIISNSNKRYQVTDISPADLKEIYQFRELLECQIIRETALKFSPEELNNLEEILNAADQFREAGDIYNFLKYSRRFHHAFDEKFGNSKISNVLRTLDERIDQFSAHSLKTQNNETIKSNLLEEHRMILKSIKNGDVDLAVQIMQKHLREYVKVLVKEIQFSSG